MKKMIAFWGLLALVGCGNSELESAIYRRHSGEIFCPYCPSKSPFGTHFDPVTSSVRNEEKHPIESIALEKGKVDHVWVATLKFSCPKRYNPTIVEEWSWREDKARFLRVVK